MTHAQAPSSNSALPAPIHSGKVRDLYDAGDGRLIMVASDRVSAFDVVLPSIVPDKGRVLTALSLWWFDRLADLLPNHVISADVADFPEPFTNHPDLAGRSMLVRRLEMVPVECVARGYLAGSGTKQYEATGEVCGIALPAGLVEASALPELIFTPTTKGGPTNHDEPMTFAEVEAKVGAKRAEELRELTLEVLRRGQAVCASRGILVADTKVEFGVDSQGGLILADEVLTPDSSRFWPAEAWHPGKTPPSYDKQPLRDYLETLDWDKKAPGPVISDEFIAASRQRYITAYETITGQSWINR